MTLLKTITVGIAILSLSACKDERGPRLFTVCDEYYTTVSTGVGIGASGKLVVVTVPVQTCVRSHVECAAPGVDYVGNGTCAKLMADLEGGGSDD